MDLIAVQDGKIVLVSWHEGNVSLDLALPPDEQVFQVQQLHFPFLGSWFPTLPGLLVIFAARRLHQPETGFQILRAQLWGSVELDIKLLFRRWMFPLHPTRTTRISLEAQKASSKGKF